MEMRQDYNREAIMNEGGYTAQENQQQVKSVPKQTANKTPQRTSKTGGVQYGGGQTHSTASPPAEDKGKKGTKAKIKSSGVNLRRAEKGPHGTHKIDVTPIMFLKGGTPVTIVNGEFDATLYNRKYHWVHVIAHTPKGDKEGWVVKSFIDESPLNLEKYDAWLTPDGATLYSAGLRPIGKLPGNTKLKILGHDKSTSKMVYLHVQAIDKNGKPGKKGYVKVDYVNFNKKYSMANTGVNPTPATLHNPSSVYSQYNNTATSSGKKALTVNNSAAYKPTSRVEAMPGYDPKTGHTDGELAVTVTVPPSNSNDAEFLNQAKKYAAAIQSTGIDYSAIQDEDTHVIYTQDGKKKGSKDHKGAAHIVKNRPIVINDFNDLANALKQVTEATGKKIKYLAVFAHGYINNLHGHDPRTKKSSHILDKTHLKSEVAAIQQYLADDVHVAFFSCNAARPAGDTGRGGIGEDFVTELAKYKKNVTLLSHNVSGHTVNNVNTGIYTAETTNRGDSKEIDVQYRSRNWRWDDVFDKSFRSSEYIRLGKPKDWSTHWDNHKNYVSNAFVSFYEHFAWMYLKPGMKFETFKEQMQAAWKRAYPTASAMTKSSARARGNVYQAADQKQMLAAISGMPYEVVATKDNKDLFVYPSNRSPISRSYAKGTIVGYLWKEKGMYYVTTPDGRAGYMLPTGLKKREDLVAVKESLPKQEKQQASNEQSSSTQTNEHDQTPTEPEAVQEHAANPEAATKPSTPVSKPQPNQGASQQKESMADAQKEPDKKDTPQEMPVDPPKPEHKKEPHNEDNGLRVNASHMYVNVKAGANIRRSPGGRRIGALAYKTKVKVLDPHVTPARLGHHMYNWVHVDAGHYKGYVALSLLKPIEEQHHSASKGSEEEHHAESVHEQQQHEQHQGSTPSHEEKTHSHGLPYQKPKKEEVHYQEMYVRVGAGANLRSSPAGHKIGFLPYKSEVKVLSKDAKDARLHGHLYHWVYVQSGAHKGYIAKSLLSPLSHSAPQHKGSTGQSHEHEAKPAEGTHKQTSTGSKTSDVLPGHSNTKGSGNLAPANKVSLKGLKGIDRVMAGIYNKYGKYLEEKAKELGIPVEAAAAVLKVESGGSGFVKGRMKIRFENHVFYRYWGKKSKANRTRFFRHFKFNKSQTWKGHYFRKSVNERWKYVHANQSREWEVFNFAKTLGGTAAYYSISMGLAQIMGFNYKSAGYSSVQQMFNVMSKSVGGQLDGLFAFVRKNPVLLRAAKRKAWSTFARHYNGSGQVAKYSSRLRVASASYKRILRKARSHK